MGTEIKHPRLEIIRDTYFNLDKRIYSFNQSFLFSMEVEKLIKNISDTSSIHFTICSSGSFARRELSPYSDIDVMFIVEDSNAHAIEIKDFLTSCWDTGIEISHTVRTIQDIDKFAEDDIVSFTQFFELRFLAGDSHLFDKFYLNLKRVFDSATDRQKIFYSLIDDYTKRHEKYGNSPKVVEPHLKNSTGGLRDFQLVQWLFTLQFKDLLSVSNPETNSLTLPHLLLEKELSSDREAERLMNGYEFLITVRNLLHLYHKRRSDRLEFEDQNFIGEYLFSDENPQFAHLMRKYFEATVIINRFTKSFIKRLRKELFAEVPDYLQVELDNDFFLKGGILDIRVSPPLTQEQILKTFYYRAFYDSVLDGSLRNKIIESTEGVTWHTPDPEAIVYFRKLMQLDRNTGKTLEIMNELGILSLMIPEFKDFIGFIQHGVYHYYTGDEHTLKAIENLENLEKETSLLGNTYKSLPHIELLRLGVLFHDIAKPISIQGHHILGVDLARNILDRFGYDDQEIDLVIFLVQHHLLMEQVAFRRNLNDPETLNSFTSKFHSSEYLDYLYLLTFADLSAVNPALWTVWKQELLSELFRKAKAMLDKSVTGEALLLNPVSPRKIRKHARHLSEEHIADHIDSIKEIGYGIAFKEEEIALHIEKINSGEPVSVIFNQDESYTSVTVITKDSPSLLSKLCGVLSINDVNIHDAKIFTRRDGIVIDKFIVSDFRVHKHLETERYSKISEDFYNVITGLLQIGSEIKNMRSRWKRLESRFFKRPGTIRIKFEEHEQYTIIDIFSPDRLGFLYHVTKKMNELGLNIHFAKIATRGDGIVDAFYVLDRSNKKVSKNYYHFIETELTHAIQNIL